jgi:hypothetical protein
VCCIHTRVVYARIGLLIKIVHLLYSTVYVSKLPCRTHTKSKWKWIPKYADCDIQKRMFNCRLSVKYTQSSNYFFNKQKVIISIIIHIVTIICAALVRLEVREKQVFIFIFFCHLLFVILIYRLFRSDHRQTILFAKIHTLELFLFCKVYQ